MSVKYKLYQDKNSKSKFKGQFYARAVMLDVVDLSALSKEIEENTTAKQADVYAVLKELVNVMRRHLQNSNRVVLDGFGSFKVGIKTKPALTEKEFSGAKNIVGARINFQPETHWTASDRTHRSDMLLGLKCAPLEDTPAKNGAKPSPNPKS